MNQPNRYDYVAYDDEATDLQAFFKAKLIDLETAIEAHLKGRAAALAITKSEELYMWIGKAIRDDQIARNGSAPLQEERGNDMANREADIGY